MGTSSKLKVAPTIPIMKNLSGKQEINKAELVGEGASETGLAESEISKLIFLCACAKRFSGRLHQER